MRAFQTVEEFARRTHIDSSEIARYRDAGLLDPESDGRFDEYDTLRQRFLKVSASGRPPKKSPNR